MRYTPGAAGARTVKANVATAPGATLDSLCAAGRSGASQFTLIPRAAKVALSPLIPRFACDPATPFCQVAVPVLRKWSVSCVVAPGWSVGNGDSSTKAVWYVSAGENAVVPAVVKLHWFVVITPFTLMSKRT